MDKTKTKTFVIGSAGFLGKHFLESYRNDEPKTIGTQHFSSDKPFYFNLEKPDIRALPLNEGYTHALIAASTGLFVECEKQYEKTAVGNVYGTLQLAKSLAEVNITPILFSSSYVFDGNDGQYSEESLINPINGYGLQKAEVEKKIDHVCKGNYLLLRLSKVFTLAKGDGTLLDEIVQKLVSQKTIFAAHDQIFTPILIDDVIRITQHLQALRATGLYHICGTENWSRYDLTKTISSLLSSPPTIIQSISLDDLPDKIKRPKKTNMLCQKALNTGISPPKTVTECIQIMQNLWVEHV
ncbi:MAG: hypothetical protein COT85_07015 [Chlamydiae bacterium CG10_big_fil_rev_8_21_14_0_10_42_34]|nr:MAG: hypothetical protein COT85_07015 [Chlamydiae bacterium CG10_big_fil_rev_8_21_14_0_10_42_34]